MPSFPLIITPDGATLDVGVSAPAVYVTTTTPPGTWKALVDTGATTSIISPDVVKALLPPSYGVSPVGRAGWVNTFEPTYEVRFRLGGHRHTLSRWFDLEVVGIQPATAGVDILIGTDLLIRLDLSWRGTSRVGSLSY
jgi:hypothetical protein